MDAQASQFLFTKRAKPGIMTCPKPFSRKACMEPVEAIESPGKYLKLKRESQRLSLNKVAKETRIREAILRGIEEDKYEDLPDLYVKSFLRTYAECLGLDSNELIPIQQKHTGNLLPSKRKTPNRDPISRKRRVNVRRVVIIISVILLATLLVYASFRLLPKVFSSLWTEESRPSPLSSIPSSPPVQKETEFPKADQPGTNEIQPIGASTDKEP